MTSGGNNFIDFPH